jgi:short-subunit dehydrogenase
VLWKRLSSQSGLGRVFYFAGGGPYGDFSSKELKDHRWALETTFMGAMEALHFAMRNRLKQIVFVGSSIAEDQADPRAASYSAAKHALFGLLRSVWEETPSDVDVRLFSPGYMDTSLLPPGATARQQDLSKPDEIAARLLEWCLDPEGQRHYKLTT